MSTTALVGGVLATMLTSAAVEAQANDWNVAGLGDWSSSTNWSGGAVPNAADDVRIINSGTARLSTAGSANSVTVGSGGLAVLNGGVLTSPDVSIIGSFPFFAIDAGGQIIGNVTYGTQQTGANGGANAGTITGNLNLNGGSFINSGRITGQTTVGAGNLTLNAGSNLPDSQPLTVHGGMVNVNVNQTVGSLNGTAGAFVIANGVVLTINQTMTSEYNGNITGAGGLTKNGAETLTLAGVNTYSGLTTVNAGALQLFLGSAIADTGAVVVNAPGRLEVNSSETIGSLSGNGSVQIKGRIPFSSVVFQTLTIGGDNTSTTFSGSISENRGENTAVGGITKIGTGTLTLTGANTYSGTTTISGGTLQIGDGGTSGTLGRADLVSNLPLFVYGTGDVVNNAALTFNRSDTITVANAISGSGSLNQNGIGTTVLTGANTYAGTTTINGGTLQIGAGGTIGTLGTGNVVNNGSLAFNRSDNVTVSNVISGTGTLTKLGGGILTLTGANTYSGITRVEAGTLRLGAGGSLNSASLITVSSGATFDFGSINNPTIGSLGGTGGSLTGGTGNLNVQMAAGSTETFSGTNPFGGFNSLILSGNGTLNLTGDLNSNNPIVINGGTLNLAGNNTLTGGITVNGRLVISAGNAAGGAGNTITTTGSVISYANNIDSPTPIVINSNTTQLEVVGADAATQSGVISETGGSRPLEKIGTGTLTLSATNVYTGPTTITAGTLQIGNGGTSGTLGSGNVINNGRLVFNRSNAVTVANAISGTGQVQFTGGGTTTLSGGPMGVNSLTGGIEIAGTGTRVNFADTGTTGGGGNVITLSGTGNVLGLTGPAGTFYDKRIVLTGTGAKFDVTSSAVFQTNVVSGTGGFEKTGTGTLQFTGPTAGVPLINTYSGPTTISGGSIQIDDIRSLGDDSTTNRLVFNGGLLTINGGTPNTMARGVTVEASGGGLISVPDLALNGGISFNGGTLIKGGLGALTFNGTGTGTGTLRMQQGSLFLNNSAALGGATLEFTNPAGTSLSTNSAAPVTVANPVVLTNGLLSGNSGATSMTLSGPISGGSGITKGSDGTLNLTGNNTFAGGVALNAGTLGVGSNTALGTNGMSAATQATLRALSNVTLANSIVLTPSAGFGLNNLSVDTNGFNMTLSGVISTNVPALETVQPGLTKNGAGNLTLTGANTYRGATVVNAGALIVNGSIANTSGVTVANGARFGGNAAISNLTVQSGATLSPGNSIGTVSIAGNLTLNAGSTTVIELEGALADRINAGGTATLAGTLDLVALGGTYAFSSPYTIITATGGATGAFATVNTAPAFGVGVTSTVTYNANNVQVTLNPVPLTPAPTTPPPATTPTPPPAPTTPQAPAPLGLTSPLNPVAVATGLDRAVAAGGNASPFFNIYNQPNTAALITALNSLSGEVHASASAMGFQTSDQFLRVMLDPTNIGRNVSGGNDEGNSIWGAAYGQSGRTSGESAIGSTSRSASDWNLAFGADFAVHPTSFVGVAASGGQATASLGNQRGTAKADVFQLGVSSMSRFGDVSLNLAGSWSILDVDTSRAVPTLATDPLKASYQAQVWSGRAEAAYAAMRLSDTFTVSPFAAVQASSSQTPGFVENLNGAIVARSLAVNGQTNNQVRSELGVRLDVASVGQDHAVKLYARAAWGHYFTNHAAVSASLTGLPGSAFTVTGARPARDSALLSFGADMKFDSGLTLGASINAELSDRQNSVGGSAKLKIGF